MDFQDVSEQYRDMLRSQNQTLENAKRRAGEKPEQRKSKEDLVNEFMMTVAMHKIQLASAQFQSFIRSSFVPPAYLPCDKNLNELQRMAISGLRLETHHRGKYLLLRSLTPPYNMTSLTVIVEDLAGDAVQLALYHQQEKGRPEECVISQGSIVVVKEPYLKVTSDGGFGLRVDHLSDVLFTPQDHLTIPDHWRTDSEVLTTSAVALKLKGNLAMGKGKWWEAIKDYTNALKIASPSESEIIRRNRALSYLKIGHQDATLDDLAYPRLTCKSSPKALLRAAEALYCLERFKESSQVLELLLESETEVDLASKNLQRARERLQEQQSGQYNFALLQAEAKRLRPPILDHASFLDNVDIRQTETRGRGVFVTKAIKMGDVIMVEKAFAYAFADEKANNTSLLMHPESNRATIGTHSELLVTLVHRIHHNPSLAARFTNLHRGSYVPAERNTADSQPVTDTFLVDRIMALNGFGCSTSSLETIRRDLDGPREKEKKGGSVGIWTQASYINHNCIRTASRSFVGDMMIIRATRDLRAGEEVTFWYQPPGVENASELSEGFANWNFACDCTLCDDIRATPARVSAERKKLYTHVKKLLDTKGIVHYRKIEKIMQSIEDTYTQSPEKSPRRQLWELYLRLASDMVEQCKLHECLRFERKGLASLGYTMSDPDSIVDAFQVSKPGLIDNHVVGCFVQMATVFRSLGKPKSAQRAFEYARVIYKICVGEDSTFEPTYRALAPEAFNAFSADH